ncbi:substrate-binding domain-containing protein [Phytohabitans sp. ZYX-F-186]|uniref:Substrate-binding domain-containing protein n=1 Tax=Phytohabitans maris TaxID=3071409 RepID=A0ABU0ZFJ0_9ACTN|nr:substrate-binding domain-containing protein [Phytohabitans sp. ZYX-F-186]MDQ7905753.1 substrate-binding domain-containing protein [Phytohabitans sp. ZYX-F-186]
MSISRLRPFVAVVALSALLAGCGEAGSADTGGRTTTDAVLEKARTLVAANFAGTDRDLPASGPAAVKGKNVVALACSATAPGCALPAQGFVDAATALGWTARLVDGKLDPSVYNTQIRAAATAGADAVALFGVDCAAAEGAIKSARQAGTLVFAGNALDCDDTYAGGGEAIFDGGLIWGTAGTDYGRFLDEQVGTSIAAWVIAETGGKAKVLQMRQDDSATTRHTGESEFKALSECGGCRVDTVPYTGADLLGGKLQAKLSAALQRHPDADVVMVPADAAISLGAGAAVEQARAGGRELLLVGHEGVPSSIQLIRKGQQSFALGRPWPWTGWATADALNRHFAGAPQVDPGFGFGAMDAEHLPAGDVYDGNADSPSYQDNYRRIWGVS